MSAIDNARQSLIDALLVERSEARVRAAQVEGLLGDLLRTWTEGDLMDIDGCEVQDLVAKWKFSEPAIVTAELEGEGWAMELGLQEGDDCFLWTPIMQRILRNDR